MNDRKKRKLDKLRAEARELCYQWFEGFGMEVTVEVSEKIESFLQTKKEIKANLKWLKDKWLWEKSMGLVGGFKRIARERQEPVSSGSIIKWKPLYNFKPGMKKEPVEDPLESLASLEKYITNIDFNELPPGWSWYLDELRAKRLSIDDILEMEPTTPEYEYITREPDFLEMRWIIITIDGDYRYEFFSFIDFIHYIHKTMKTNHDFTENTRELLSNELGIEEKEVNENDN